MNFGRLIKDFAVNNAPAILTGLGVAGTVSAVVLAVKATPQAVIDIHNHESEVGEKTTWYEKAQLTWRHYVPTASVTAMTVATIIGAQTLNHRRQAALISAYALAETSLRDYRMKTQELHGEKADQQVLDSIAEDRIKENPVKNSEIIITGSGEHLCYDDLTGRYFKSDIETIRSAVNDINSKCLSETYASQNDFYRLIGLDPVAFGEEHGWRFDHLMDVHFSSHVSSDNTPALSLMYETSPIRGYYKINR